MEKYKQRLTDCESKLAELGKIVSQSLKGKQNEPISSHFVGFEKEQGIIPLDEYDTFRFIQFKNVDYQRDGQLLQNRTVYCLLNPPIEFIDIFRELEVDRHNSTILIDLNGGVLDEVENYDIFVIMKVRDRSIGYTRYYGNNPRIEIYKQVDYAHAKEMKKILSNRIFECCDNIFGKTTLRVDFKNAYAIPPHVHTYITPFENADVEYRIKQLSTKFIEWEIIYGKGGTDVHKDACLHWFVEGVVEN
jgi:hypothetical protein